MVTVRFKLTLGEVCSCYRRLQTRRWTGWALIIVGLVIAATGLLFSVAWPVVFGIAYALFSVIGVWVLKPLIMWRQTPQLRAEQSIIVSDAGIRTEYINASTTAEWSFWPRASLVRGNYVLWARRRTYVQIPRRAFSSTADEQRFLELLRAHADAPFAGSTSSA